MPDTEESIRLAPEVFRQRFLIDLVTGMKISKSDVERYLNGIVEKLGLKISGGSDVYDGHGKGKKKNEGFEGFVGLIDSGISISIWAESGLVSIFIHTCKPFSEEDATAFTK